MTAIMELSTQKISEESYIGPLVTLLEEATPRTAGHSRIISESETFHKSLNDLFPEQQYDEKKVQKAKEILGEVADGFTPEQLKDIVTEIQYLVDSWLDDFERDVFPGKTLKELLHERGGL